MFSMFGRTEALRKQFCVARWRPKVSSQVLPAGNWHTALLLCAYKGESLTKCRWWQHCHCACRVNSVGRFAYSRGPLPPHFLLNTTLLRLNPALWTSDDWGSSYSYSHLHFHSIFLTTDLIFAPFPP